MAKVLGIDLGTTNSCVAVMQGGEPVVIPNAEGARTTPSVVAFTKSGERLVGEAARRQAITNAENTIFSIKRLLGCKYRDPAIERLRLWMPFRIVEADNGDAWVEVLGKRYSPPEIAALLLQKLKADAEAYLGEGVTQAVLALPAYATNAQQRAIRLAGKLAGLEVLRVISTPNAASVAYGLDKKKDERILVYDLGGGTLDIAVLELGDGVFEVKSTNGDTHLGGDDFDQRIMSWLADEFRRKQGVDLRQDRVALLRLWEAAEKAKRELSSAMQTEINLPYISADQHGPKHLTMTLTRARLEELAAEIVEKSRLLVMKALEDASVRATQVDRVLLVGGQARLPLVQQMVKRVFEKEPHKGVHLDETVALGAAIQAGVLTGEVRDVMVLDATPFSLGVETLGGVFTRLIERNTTIPTQRLQVFSTASDNQGSVAIIILQGEGEFAKDSQALGCVVLDGIPPAPRGIPQIEVAFDIDANSIVSVHVKDKGTGREQRINLEEFAALPYVEQQRRFQEARQLLLPGTAPIPAPSPAPAAEQGAPFPPPPPPPKQAAPPKQAPPPPPPEINWRPPPAGNAPSAGGVLAAGAVLAGRYRIERVVGGGGMGRVYRAFDQNLQQPCAVKVMLDDFGSEEERGQAVEWFKREARMLLALHHPAIPRIFDSFAEAHQHYVVMDFVEGRTLAQVLEQEGQPRGLPEQRVRSWALQLCVVLAYLHSLEPPVIFRDLKPSNIMLTGKEQIKLIDFGIARLFDRSANATLIWTPGFAAPEQQQGKPQPHSDIYALGATLHHLLTQHRAINNAPTLFDFPPVRKLRAELSPGLEGIISKALSPLPAGRWGSANAMWQALKGLAPLGGPGP